VDDPFAPTGVVLNPPKPVTGVAVRSNAVLAKGSNRLDVAHRALASVAVEQGAAAAATGTLFARPIATFGQQGSVPVNLRQAALQQVVLPGVCASSKVSSMVFGLNCSRNSSLGGTPSF
jgi:hypothetical protein